MTGILFWYQVAMTWVFLGIVGTILGFQFNLPKWTAWLFLGPLIGSCIMMLWST